MIECDGSQQTQDTHNVKKKKRKELKKMCTDEQIDGCREKQSMLLSKERVRNLEKALSV